MGGRPRCLTQLQSLLMWWVFPRLSAEPSSDSARAPRASGEDFSSCRHLLLKASILGCYWLPSLLCMPVKEFLAVGWGSTAGCAWNQLSSSLSTFPMLCSSLTASCSSATCHTKWGTECFSCLHALGSWQLCLLTRLSPKLWKYKNSPTTFFSVRELRHYFILARMLFWPRCTTEIISSTHFLGCAEKVIPSHIFTRFFTYLFSQNPEKFIGPKLHRS